MIIFLNSININICDEYKYILIKYIMILLLLIIINDKICVLLVLCGILGYGIAWLSLNFCETSYFGCENSTVYSW